MIKAYYLLTKPGIIYSNVLTALGGFFLAAKGNITFITLLAMAIGLGLVIASACVINNFIDRDIDAKMVRTKKRPLVNKIITGQQALIYASLLGVLGFLLLLIYTNYLTAILAFIGFFFYVIPYTFSKRGTVHSTVIGSISGAVPPVVGYCAVTNQIDIAAVILFLILVFWQMPHFYAISIFRYDDYVEAKLPVLPVKKGIFHAKLQMFIYVLIFCITSISLFVFHFTGFVYVIVMVTVGIMWLILAALGLREKEDKIWARKMFLFSLVIILIFSLLLIFTPLLF